MASATHVQEVYARHSQTADICITEGVMGLFDGYDNMAGSSAELAGLLHLPVILVVNARSTAYTVAAILYGFKHFRPDIQIAGAVFNFVGSESHYTYLQQACRDAGVEALGYLPKCKGIEIPSRHLGLNIDSEFCFDEFADRIACQVEQTVGIDRLLDICSCATAPSSCLPGETNSHASDMRIAIACDEAFNFIYPENLRVLEQKGKLTFFSPLYDSELPVSDLVYLPGGYPEFYLSRLSENRTMRQSILNYCQNGGHLFAECGGMMYLGEYITDTDGHSYPMVRFFTARSNDGKYEIKTRISQNFSERAGIPGPRIPLLPHNPGSKPPAIHCPGNECQRDGSRYAGLSFRACHCQLYSLLLGRSSPVLYLINTHR